VVARERRSSWRRHASRPAGRKATLNASYWAGYQCPGTESPTRCRR
jgi:hypothetical protein